MAERSPDKRTTLVRFQTGAPPAFAKASAGRDPKSGCPPLALTKADIERNFIMSNMSSDGKPVCGPVTPAARSPDF
jgi:hypothetical protein